MSLFNSNVDNSKLTPEFHQNDGQGQSGQAADNTPNITNQGTNAAPTDGQVAQNNVQGIQSGDETFENQEALLEAYNSMKTELEARNKSYKELQGAYTKSRQEIAMRNKMATPNMNRQVAQPIMPVQPMPNMYNPNNPYNSPINQPFAFGNRPNMAMPTYNQYYNQQAQQAPLVNEAMINMAAESKIAELKGADPDFDEVAGELWNIMENDGYFANIKFTDPDMAKNAIGAAYQMAKQKIEAAKANIKINNAKAEAYNNKQQKVLNNDNSNVAKNNKGQQPMSPEDKIKGSIVSAKPIKF